MNDLTHMLSDVFGENNMQLIASVATKLAVSVVIIVIAALVIKLLRRFVIRSTTLTAKTNPRKAKTINTMCFSLIKYVIYFIAACQILVTFGVSITSIVAIGGAVSVAIGLGAQDLIHDVLTGLFLLMEDQIGIGDFISVEGCSGKVESIGIRTTSIRSTDGNLYIVPNGQIKIVTNMSKGFNRAVVDIGVAYEEDVDRVIRVLEKDMKDVFDNEKIEGLLKVPDVLGIVELGDSSVTIRISADCAVGENWAIERQIRKHIPVSVLVIIVTDNLLDLNGNR